LAKSGLKHIDVGAELTKTEWESEDSHEVVHGNSFPGSPVERQLFYRDDEHKWYIYNASAWVWLGGGGGGMAVHGNEYHDPDFAEVSHTHSDLSPAHKDITTGVHGVGAGTIAKVGDIAVDSNLSSAAQDAIAKKHTQGTDVALGAVGTKNPPIDADKALYRNSESADALVTSTWTQIKAFLKTYFDTIYRLATADHTHQSTGAQAGKLDHGLALDGLGDDDHTQYIKHSLATAISDFLVASGAGAFVKKTLAEVKTILGLGTAAYTASTDYVTHALATAANDFLVASGAGAFVKKTLAETKTILNWAADIATHAGLTTGVHGVGAGTVAKTSDIPSKVIALTFIIDGGGSAITTGQKGHLEIPFACTITGWTLLADQSGSIVIDVWKDTYANFPPTVADTIAGSEKPTLSSAQKNQDLTLTTWTTAVAAGDILAFNVDSVSTVTRVTLSIRAEKS